MTLEELAPLATDQLQPEKQKTMSITPQKLTLPTNEEAKTKVFKHQHYDLIKKLCSCRLPIYLHGPTGSGKTHIFRDIAAELNLPFYKKLIGAQMTEMSLTGYNDAHGVFHPGIVYEPYKNGGLLVLDEIDNGNPNTNLVFNGLCDQEFAFPCGMVSKHNDFVVVATANTIGTGADIKYVGRNKLDAAMLNRFVFVDFPYDPVLETNLAYAEFLKWSEPTTLLNEVIREKFLGSVHDFFRVRAALKELGFDTHILSQRNLLQQSRMIAQGFTGETILTSIILRNLKAEDVAKVSAKAKEIKITDLATSLPPVTLTEADKVAELINIEKEIKVAVDKKLNELRQQFRTVEMQRGQKEMENNALIQKENQAIANANKELTKLRQEVEERKQKLANAAKNNTTIAAPASSNIASGINKDLPNWDEVIMDVIKPLKK